MRLSNRVNFNKLKDNEISKIFGIYESNIIDLTVSNPLKAFDKILDKEILSAFLNKKNLQYVPSPFGEYSARESVASYYKKELEIDVSPDNIFLTPGTSEGYSYLFKLLCDFRDNVLIPVPGYPLFDYIAKFEGINIKTYPLEYIDSVGWKIDFYELEKAIDEKTKAIIVVNPNNPTGSLVLNGDIEKLNLIANKYDIAIISDEVFSDYIIDNYDNPISLWEYIDNTLFVLGGLSKSFSMPQMKMGWILFKTRKDLLPLLKNSFELLGDTYLSVSMPIQYALGKWMTYKRRINPIINKRLKNNYLFLTDYFGDSYIKVPIINGGWNAVLEIPRIKDEENITIDLVKKYGVKVFPGYFFDFPKNGYLVISLIVEEQSFETGIREIGKYFEEELK